MKKNFTLIELLVVIAIIAILAGLVMPALGHAQAKGRTTECINNKKQVMTVLRMYGNDHSSMVPYAISVKKGGSDVVRPYSWILGGCENEGNYSREMVSKKSLICNTSNNKELIGTGEDVAKNDENDESTNAFGMIDVDFEGGDTGWYKVKRKNVGRFVAKNDKSIAYVLEKMKSPSEMILLADSFKLDGDVETPYWTFSPWKAAPQMVDDAKSTNSRIAIPHVGSSVVAYADGRAEALTANQLATSSVFKPEDNEKFYYYDGNMDPVPKD